MEPALEHDDWVDMPDLGVEHPSLLPPEQPYLRIERTFIFVDLTGFTAFTRIPYCAHLHASSLVSALRTLVMSMTFTNGFRGEDE